MTSEEFKLIQQLKKMTAQVEELQRRFKRAKRNQFIGTIVVTILGALVGTLCLRLLV